VEEATMAMQVLDISLEVGLYQHKIITIQILQAAYPNLVQEHNQKDRAEWVVCHQQVYLLPEKALAKVPIQATRKMYSKSINLTL